MSCQIAVLGSFERGMVGNELPACLGSKEPPVALFDYGDEPGGWHSLAYLKYRHFLDASFMIGMLRKVLGLQFFDYLFATDLLKSFVGEFDRPSGKM